MRPALEASCTAYTPCLRGDRGACDHNLDGGASPSKAVGSESPLKLGGNLGASPRPPLKKSPSRSGLSATVIAAAAPKSRHVAPGVNNKSTCLRMFRFGKDKSTGNQKEAHACRNVLLTEAPPKNGRSSPQCP
ncbi:hypothetical protein MRX96_030805 [Rhipicephalus microplus]